MVKIIVVSGSRNWEDYVVVSNRFDDEDNANIILMNGGARGLDEIARQAADDKGWAVSTIHANWKRFDRRAGPIRNRRMLDFADYVIAFHENYSNSKGTKDLVETAKRLGIPGERIDADGYVVERWGSDAVNE